MALGDLQYQVNDLKAQLTILQNTVRAVNPGNQPSLGPLHPLSPITSTGQSSSGADSDNVSRAATTAVQEAIAGVEALQYVQTQPIFFDLGANTTYTIRTEFLRPDPVIGQVYRATIGGSIFRGAGAGYASAITVGVTGGSSTTVLGTLPTGGYIFFLQVVMVVTQAGTSAIMQVNSLGSQGPSTGAFPIVANATELNDSLLSGTIAGNLTGGSINFTITTTALSAGASLTVTCYLLESLGYRTG